MTVVWDPQQYTRFAGERSRPFRELVGRIDLPEARLVVDLGCGEGSLTAELADRWPAASVEGVDSSPEMIEAAARHDLPPNVSFRVGDLRNWTPAEAVDVLVSNATLQWVPDHLERLAHLVAQVRPGGFFAFQVPANFAEPSHRLLDELCRSPRWAAALGDLPRPRSCTTGEYLDALLALALAPDVWETTYFQLLQGPGAVLEWMKGTALRPVIAALSTEDGEAFLAELGELLDGAYPPGASGTVLPFRRIFAVARVPGEANAPVGAVVSLDHVQLAMPPGREDEARAFYAGVLGLAERPKPPALAPRGGCWFSGHRAEVHLGVEADFRPGLKAHVALGVTVIDELAQRVEASGFAVTWDDGLAPRRRFYTADPFGNRLEIMER
jgi:trans-aconitate 2-methyltransferase